MATIQYSVKASQRSCHKKLRPEGLAWLGAGVQSKEKILWVGLGLGKTGRVHSRNWKKLNVAGIGREAKKSRKQADARRGYFTKKGISSTMPTVTRKQQLELDMEQQTGSK